MIFELHWGQCFDRSLITATVSSKSHLPRTWSTTHVNPIDTQKKECDAVETRHFVLIVLFFAVIFATDRSSTGALS
jgi:hypothetical protein